MSEPETNLHHVLIDSGIAALKQGNLDEAEQFFLEALQHVETSGDTSEWLTYNLSKLAEEYAKQSLYVKAETIGRIALTQAQAAATSNPDLENSLTSHYDSLGEIFLLQKMFDQAEEMFNQSFALDQSMSRDEDPSVAHLGWVNMASDLHNIAEVEVEKGDYVRAEVLIREALEIDLKHLAPFLEGQEDDFLGPPSFVIATKDMFPLAQLCALQKKYEEAEQLYRDALAICREHVDRDGVFVAHILRGYASMLRELGRTDEAEKLELEADSIRRTE
jgi:tetratricopeptide (TPR) repeat protein